jgi:hypothetical protein
MSRLGAGGFSAGDLQGGWRMYLHRVDAALASSTIQIGQATFNATGALSSGSLMDISAPPVFTTFATGRLSIDGTNGSVTGTLATAGGAARYTVRGTMRAARDLVLGVLTANVSGQVSFGLVALVHDASFLDFSQAAYTVTEGNTLMATVQRTGSTSAPATVTWTATGAAGDLASPTNGTLMFPAGASSATFMLRTLGNSAVDGNRSAMLTLSNPAGPGAALGARVSATLAIVDDDRPGTVRLSAASYTVAETAKSVPIMIQRTLGTGGGVAVQFALTDDTAQAGRDYTVPANASVTFNAGETVKTVNVPILDNLLVDGPRTFGVALTNVSATATLGTPASATVTITDNEVGGSIQFSAGAFSVAELVGASTSAAVVVTRKGGTAGGVLVDFATADGTARAGQQYTATSGTLTFHAGNTSAAFSVPCAAGSRRGRATARCCSR